MGNTRGYTFVSAITVKHPSTESYFKVKGDYTPKELWHDLSLALLEHDIICEPLHGEMILPLPSSESTCSF